jgi:hypothetical protein
LTILYSGLIVAGSFIDVWVGLGVFIVETALIVWWIFRRGRREQPIQQAPPPHPEGERRILVVANETVGGETLCEEIHRRSEGVDEHVLVVSPALNSPLKHWVSDEDGARAAASQRLTESLVKLRSLGVNADGEVGDADPLQAIEDALRTFGADEIIISTHPEGRSHWLERGVVEAARERFSPPITHVVVDLANEREYTVESPALP